MDWFTLEHNHTEMINGEDTVLKIRLSDCIYPDQEGGFFKGKHHFDEDGFCSVCGVTKQQATQ